MKRPSRSRTAQHAKLARVILAPLPGGDPRVASCSGPFAALQLTGWSGLDAGYLRKDERADIAIIDPAGFDGSSSCGEAPYRCASTVRRMVNRNDGVLNPSQLNSSRCVSSGSAVVACRVERTAGWNAWNSTPR